MRPHKEACDLKKHEKCIAYIGTFNTIIFYSTVYIVYHCFHYLLLRKKAIMMMAVPGLVGDVLFGFCKMANSFEMLILGRLIIGFSCGKCICTYI